MYMNSSASRAGVLTNAKDFEVGFGMLPHYADTEPQNSIIGGATLWVLQGQTPEEYKGVADFFTYLSSPEVQADWHQFSGYLPITKAAYELGKSQGYYDEEPRLRRRHQADHAEPADRELQGPALRQLRADPRRDRPGVPGAAGRQQDAQQERSTPWSSAATS